ncbi:hypothetical protein KY290_024687 [Solanum tuberosum]|uniref:Ankyrin repeat-containing protein n=1 Tax=Solanum tuberosum TaxID=4113 RepID=A0ABQ7UTD9_SOLTU|nr:hypothetical protein KY284_023534 [Solanum tuberosum]KAH0754417.1 hypothetical protein KY290_024687 [Solanum tuberosum]
MKIEKKLYEAAVEGDGHIESVKFILSRNLLLATELDFRKSFALHVASIKVIKGRVEVIKELVQASYLATLQTTEPNENILHLCVKHNNQLETLNLLEEINMYNRKEYNGDKG